MATTRLMMQRQARRLLGTSPSPSPTTSAAAAAALGPSPLLPLGAENAVVRCKGLPVQTEGPTRVPPLRFMLQRRLLATDASPATTAAREGSRLPLLPSTAQKATLSSKEGAVQINSPMGIDPLAAAQGLPPFGFGSRDAVPQISPMGAPALLFCCKDSMGQLKPPSIMEDPLAVHAPQIGCNDIKGQLKVPTAMAPLAVHAPQIGCQCQGWTKLTLHRKEDWNGSELMGVQVVGKPDENEPPAKDESPPPPPPPKGDLPPPPPPKEDDPTLTPPLENNGKGGAGGVPPSGSGSRGAGNWSGGFENYLLYKLSEMRREQREESWKQYEQSCKLQKEMEDFRRDTQDKITKTQLILSNTALRLIGSILLLLLGGAKLAFPYVQDYIEMVLKREMGDLKNSAFREFFKDHDIHDHEYRHHVHVK